MIPKVIAFYLPQFHEVKENSLWYGEGYTDWVAAKKAVPLFEGHNQPRIPLNKNYYDLSNIKTIKWQASVAYEYGVNTFCFYHYWFQNSKQLLEKPAELLLQHREIDIEYCFSWANEPWKRTWSNIEGGNAWCDLYDGERKNKSDKGLLVGQTYGREEEWKRHIEYLLPFFKDDRYLKIDGRPVFFLYQPQAVFCLKAMMQYWNDRLCREGVGEIYFAGGRFEKNYLDKVEINYNHEPRKAFAECRSNKEYIKNDAVIEMFDYDTLWKYILGGSSQKAVPCAFTDYDASPRKGSKGIVVSGSTPQKFGYYLKKLMAKAIDYGHRFILVNAWNEWGEGMYLEPDEKNGYGYLQAVKEAVEFAKAYRGSNDCRACNTEKYLSSEYIPVPDLDQDKRKKSLQIDALCQWVSVYQGGMRIKDFFFKYNYKTVAIYGMGILGKLLLNELNGSGIKVLYYIDRYKVLDDSVAKVIHIEQELPEVDGIIVTALAEFDCIYDLLRRKSKASIIDMREILAELL